MNCEKENFIFCSLPDSLNDSIMQNPFNDECFLNFLEVDNFQVGPLFKNQFSLEDSFEVSNINIENQTNNIKTKKSTKKEKSTNKENESKYLENNIIRKIKCKLLSYLCEYINSTILKVYEGKIGKGIFEKKLRKLNKNQTADSKLDKEFINKTLKDIFSNDISGRYSYYKKDHNKKLIQYLLNEENLEKREIFKNLFSLTFLDVLKHIRGENFLEQLEGIQSLDTICKQFDDNKNYQELFRYYFFHFEEIVIEKRKTKKKKK